MNDVHAILSIKRLLLTLMLQRQIVRRQMLLPEIALCSYVNGRIESAVQDG